MTDFGWYLPPGVTSRMIDALYQEPQMTWAVKILEDGKWKLWNEYRTEKEAELVFEDLESKGYEVRVEEV